ncbi:MAG: hypothetical protein IKP71_08615 [Candidatus Riflebacteria bacterium]|nr:hypothetical protein [Candidatus Riflebacteria bacterium]
MKNSVCLLASVLMLSATALLADVSIPYGEGSGKVDFTNFKKYPKLEDPLPFGPLSFRMVDNKVWVADSIGGKLMQYDNNGKLVSEFSVMPEGIKPYKVDEFGPSLNILIEDIAAVRGDYGSVKALWVVDSQKNKLLKFSPDGKKLAEVKNPEFGQLYRIEVSRSGYLFVADKAKRAIYVLDSEGKVLNTMNWEWSGMAVSSTDDILYRLMWDNEAHRNILVSTNLEGKVVATHMLDVEMLNPQLWWVDESKQECLITYTPLKGFNGTFNVVRVGLDGKVKSSGELTAPVAMNRIIENVDYTDIYVGKCNFLNAPEGKFEIVPFKLP